MNSRSYLIGWVVAGLLVFQSGLALAKDSSMSAREREMDRTVAGLLIDESEGVGQLASADVEAVPMGVPQQPAEVGTVPSLAVDMVPTEMDLPNEPALEGQSMIDEVQSLERDLAGQGYTEKQVYQIIEEKYAGQLDALTS